nr:hypothetical protein [Tanacetum cinerariifolium]
GCGNRMFTQNRSIIRIRHGKTPYELLHRLVRTSSSSTSYVPPSRNDWDLLFQSMFNELLNPSLNVVNQAAEVIALITEVIPQVDVDSTGSPSSTTVDQDAPSPIKSLTATEKQPSVILQDVGNDNLDIEVAHMGNDPLLDVPIPEFTSEQSSSTASPQSNMQPNHPMTHHNSKWTKDHPMNNIIGQLSRPVSTRLQLHEQALFCYYDAFLTSVEPMTYKEPLTQACWIEAMQEELNEFERLEVWELVPRPDKVMKYGFDSCDPVDTPMVEKSKLDEDKEGKAVDPSHYRVKRIFRYLRGTVNRGLWYPKDSSVALIAFADADRAGCKNTRRSTSENYGLAFNKIPMYYDNKSAIALCSNNVQHSRSKHIDIRYHFIKEHVENGVTELYFINTEYQLADLFTKALGRDIIEFLTNKLGMISFTPETLKQLMNKEDE